MKEKTLVIIIKQTKLDTGGLRTSTEEIGDKELTKYMKQSFLQELLRDSLN